jgi:signal transduction histidine kinase
MPALLIAANGDVLAINRDAQEFLAPGSRPSKKFNDLSLARDVPELRSAVKRVQAGGSAGPIPITTRRATGPEAHFEATVRAVSEANGVVTAVLVAMRDQSELLAERREHEALRAEHAELVARQDEQTTEMQTMNEELEATNEELRQQVHQLAAAEEADIRKNQFLAMLAHELRNPLGAAVNALHIIRRTGGQDRRVHHATQIAERQLRHEARLLDDLLDVSRIILGKISVESRLVDLRASIGAAVEGVEHAAAARALSIGVDVPGEPLVVEGDATRLEQCFGNLLSNAVKFTPVGGTVRVRARRVGREAVVTVQDSGVGITPDMLERVFDLFTQADPPLARAQGGLGIGLTLVRHLVELQGGTVAARSRGRGRGSEFEIRLPASDKQATAAGPEPDVAVRPRRVLVVEDNRDARDMLRTVLRLHGHTVVDAGDGATAIRIASETVPDVVVLDIGLPDLDGFEVARRIRARLGAAVRLIGLSGYGDDEARREGRAAGFDAHLVKPVSPEALLKSLDAL